MTRFEKFLTNYFSSMILGKRRYNIKLWKTFTDCFNCLPVAAIVDEKIFCCHGKLNNFYYRFAHNHFIFEIYFYFKTSFFPNFPGGLSPDLQSMEQIRRIMRPTDVPDQGLLCDLLWSDPDKVCNTYFKFQISKEAFNPLWDIADCVIF